MFDALGHRGVAAFILTADVPEQVSEAMLFGLEVQAASAPFPFLNGIARQSSTTQRSSYKLATSVEISYIPTLLQERMATVRASVSGRCSFKKKCLRLVAPLHCNPVP